MVSVLVLVPFAEMLVGLAVIVLVAAEKAPTVKVTVAVLPVNAVPHKLGVIALELPTSVGAVTVAV